MSGLVFLAPGIPWSYPLFQRPQQLAYAFARDHRVVFVETGGDPGKPSVVEHRGRSIELYPFSKRGLPAPVRALATVVHRALWRTRRPAAVATGGKGGVQVEIRDWLRARLLLPGLERRVVAGEAAFRLFLFQYPWTGADRLARRLRARGVVCVYDMLDDFPAMVGSEQTAATEARVVAEADLVLATSGVLEAKARRLHPRVVRVPNGADPSFFALARRSLPLPSDWPFPGDAAPVIGYAGALFEWLDVELLVAIARARRDWRLVLVGLARPEVARALAGEPNLRLLPARPLADLLPCLARFDVGLIPFRSTAVTRSTDPVKLYEYLAAGKPVVATDLPELAGVPQVEVARGCDGFVDAIERALKRPLDLVAIDRFLAGQTWQTRVETILAALPLESR